MWPSSRSVFAVRVPLALLAASSLTLTVGLAAAVGQPAPPAAAVAVPAALALPTVLPTTTPRPPAAAPASRRDLTAYRGLGTWLDAYDWAPEYGGKTPVSAVDAMADRGVRTLYLQASKKSPRSPGDLLSPKVLGQFLVKAHSRGMKVQAWYLPTFDEPAVDRRRVDAILAFRASGQRFDTFGLDIEWRNGVGDVAERNRRVVALSRHLRQKAPALPLSAIVVAPVVTDDVNRQFWRPFPWKDLAPLYDVWQPMGYWTDRKASSRWSDAYTSTQGNIRLLRRDLGQPGAPVHPIGGIGATDAAAKGFVRAAREEKALGGSLYDWPTTPGARYPVLRGVPR
ncbi:MAG: N-acetylmuramoyl-L-alanine amidase [Frankiales bacterium]|nr:N-acetylmuramoyl-L-alanine amidase [Frankiales bacterium]